jgi:hypothetical protein
VIVTHAIITRSSPTSLDGCIKEASSVAFAFYPNRDFLDEQVEIWLSITTSLPNPKRHTQNLQGAG